MHGDGKNGAIAKAMGWTCITGEVGFPPGDLPDWEDRMKQPFPDFGTDVIASRMLCEWMNRQDATLKHRFVEALYLGMFFRRPHGLSSVQIVDLLSAPLPVIRDAAFVAIGAEKA